MIIEGKVKNNEVFLYIFLLPFFVAMGVLVLQKYFMGIGVGVILMIFLLLSSWLVSRLSLQYHFLMLLALVLPFSIETSVSDILKINIPAEPMLAIALFSVVWDVFRRPGYLKQFFEKENKWILPLLSSFLLTTCFSTLFRVSVKNSMVNITSIFLFFIWQKGYFKVVPDFFPKLLGLFSLSVLFVIAYAIYQYAQYDWNPQTIRGIFRPFYKDNTIFGATSALLASFWLGYASERKSAGSKIIFLLLGIVFVAGAALSDSRAAILSLVFFAVTWFVVRRGIRMKHLAYIFLTGVFLTGVFHDFLYEKLRMNKYLSHNPQASYVEKIESSINISSDVSNIERLNRWISGVRMFAEKPWMGFGPGTYQFNYIQYQEPSLMNRLTVSDVWHIPENSGGTAHSEYILMISEMGIVGMVASLLLFGRWCWIVFEKARNHPRRNSIVIGFAVLSTYIFHAFFNNFLGTDKFAFLFWGIASWMIAQFELPTEDGY